MKTKVKTSYRTAARNHRNYHNFRKAYIADYMKDHQPPPRGERGSETNKARALWHQDLEHSVAYAWVKWKSE